MQSSTQYKNEVAWAIARLLMSNKMLIALLVLFSVLGAFAEGVGLSMIAPLLEAHGNNRIFSNLPLIGGIGDYLAQFEPHIRLRITAGVLAAAVIFRAALHAVTLFLARYLPAVVQKQLAVANFNTFMKLGIGYVESKSDGEVMQLLQSVPARMALAAQAFTTIIWNAILLAILISLSVLISLKYLLLSSVFMLIFSFLYIRLTSGPLLRTGKRMSEANQAWAQNLLESIQGFTFIRLLSAESKMKARQSRSLDELMRMTVFSGILNSIPQSILMLCAGLFVAGAIFALSLNTGDISQELGRLVLFLAVLTRLIGPVSSINGMRAAIFAQTNALQLQNAFTTEALANTSRTGGESMPRFTDEVRFENLSFAYPRTSDAALQDVSFSIKKGAMVAIVGPSGAGKSTIVRLLAGLYEPDAGQIVVDGRNLASLDMESWRRRISLVSQDIFVFNDSVRNNLAFGLGDVTTEQVEDALRFANADEFVNRMDGGIDALIGERGRRLSGGQRQRLAIARSVLANPDILILDEATSQLDSITERSIQKSINNLRKGRTMMVIAHRLSTIKNADEIIVLKDGRVVERGPHAQLLAQHGQYAALLESQQLDLVDSYDTETTPPSMDGVATTSTSSPPKTAAP